jgi:hypothetical protein
VEESTSVEEHWNCVEIEGAREPVNNARTIEVEGVLVRLEELSTS